METYNLLIIDDDPNIRKLLNELLAARPEYRLLIAGNGKEAVRQFTENRIDMVLTDIHMPGFTGLELIADMQKLNFKPEILVMTANATPENVETARTIGARSVILKPFDDLEVIEAEINKALAAARAARARRNANGDAHGASPGPAAPAAAPPDSRACRGPGFAASGGSAESGGPGAGTGGPARDGYAFRCRAAEAGSAASRAIPTGGAWIHRRAAPGGHSRAAGSAGACAWRSGETDGGPSRRSPPRAGTRRP